MLAYCSLMLACSVRTMGVRQATAAAVAGRGTLACSSCMRLQAQHAMAGDDLNTATTEWQATDKCLTVHAGAPLNLDEAFASLDIPELSAKACLLVHSLRHILFSVDSGVKLFRCCADGARSSPAGITAMTFMSRSFWP